MLLDNEEPTTAADTVNFVHYKPNVEKKEQIKAHSNVTAGETDREQTDFREVINISTQYWNRIDEILSELPENAHMWDCHLGTIKTMKHRIELNDPDARPGHCAPYRAVPRL